MEVESPCRLNIDLAVPGGTAWNSHEIALDSGVSGAVVGDPAVGGTTWYGLAHVSGVSGAVVGDPAVGGTAPK